MAFVLKPEPPVSEWLADFDDFAKRSPGFFVGRPVVVDISAMPLHRPELVHIITELRRRHITIMGLDGVQPGEVGADARGLPPLLTGSRTSDQPFDLSKLKDEVEEKPAEKAAPEPAPAPVAPPVEPSVHASGATMLVEEPVRSGQSIVHMEGDVTVVGPVASGAEIVAGGSIHIYGQLRGRAIAGAQGNRKARIFCQGLSAELVAIDGLYKTAEDLDDRLRGRAAQAWLQGDAMMIAGFSERERGR